MDVCAKYTKTRLELQRLSDFALGRLLCEFFCDILNTEAVTGGKSGFEEDVCADRQLRGAK